MRESLEELPTDYGLREAAIYLGIDHSWLSRAAELPNGSLTPDRARMVAGKRVASWSIRRLRVLKRERGK